MYLEIISNTGKLFEQEVKGLILPGVDGSFELLDQHAPIVAALQKGDLRILLNEQEQSSFSIAGGFVEMLNNRATVVVS